MQIGILSEAQPLHLPGQPGHVSDWIDAAVRFGVVMDQFGEGRVGRAPAHPLRSQAQCYVAVGNLEAFIEAADEVKHHAANHLTGARNRGPVTGVVRRAEYAPFCFVATVEHDPAEMDTHGDAGMLHGTVGIA